MEELYPSHRLIRFIVAISLVKSRLISVVVDYYNYDFSVFLINWFSFELNKNFKNIFCFCFLLKEVNPLCLVNIL